MANEEVNPPVSEESVKTQEAVATPVAPEVAPEPVAPVEDEAVAGSDVAPQFNSATPAQLDSATTAVDQNGYPAD